MSIAGFATEAGTRRFKECFAGQSVNPNVPIDPAHFRQTVDGLHLTTLGMGTYLGEQDAATTAAMTQAAIVSVNSGAINVLDSAINYRCMLSERALGQALKTLLTQGVQRDELFIASKIGYLSPDAARIQRGEDFGKWFQARYFDSGLMAPAEIVNGQHCLAPGYLRDQAAISLQNFGIDTLDLLYLHNAAEAQLAVVGYEIFMERLGKAFETLEALRAEGKIRNYGMATWACFRVTTPQDALNLEAVVQLAEAIGGKNHGFRYIQFPMNLMFQEASDDTTQTIGGKPVTLLEAAKALGIGVFTSVPLLQGQLLTQALPSFPGMETPAQNCIQWVRSHPGVLAPLVGHKRMAHVNENLAVAKTPPIPQQRLATPNKNPFGLS